MLTAADEFAYSGVFFHNTHGLQFRRRIDGAGDEIGQCRVYLHLAPAFLLQELVYLKLVYGL